MKIKYSLFIDTTQNYCNLTLLNEDKIITIFSIPTNNNMTDLVIEKIKELLDPHKVKPDQLNKIYLVNGPGSFTGCRVGYIFATTLAKFFNIQLYVIDSLTFQLDQLNGISIIDAKSNMSYLSIYKKNKLIIEPCIINNNKIQQFLNQYKNLKIYKDYSNFNLKKNISIHLRNFKLIKNVDELYPLYLKEAIINANK